MTDLDYEPRRAGDPRVAMIRAIVWLVAVVYTLSFIVLFMIPSAESDPAWCLGAMPCYAWLCSPFLVLGGFASRRRASVSFLAVLLVATLFDAVGGWSIMRYVLVVNPDPQAALIFIWVVPAQHVIAGIGIGLAYAVH